MSSNNLPGFDGNVSVLIRVDETDVHSKLAKDVSIGDILIGDDGLNHVVKRTYTGRDIMHELFVSSYD